MSQSKLSINFIVMMTLVMDGAEPFGVILGPLPEWQISPSFGRNGKKPYVPRKSYPACLHSHNSMRDSISAESSFSSVVDPDVATALASIGINDIDLERLLQRIVTGRGNAQPWPNLREPNGEAVRDRLNFLQKEAGIPMNRLHRTIIGHPQLLGLSVAGLRERLDFLREEIGLDPVMLRRVLCRDPAILKSSVRRILRPAADFLSNEVAPPRCLPCRALARALRCCLRRGRVSGPQYNSGAAAAHSASVRVWA
jgi:hypothetical protein